METKNLWDKTGDKCLTHALALLESNDVPGSDVIDLVQKLVSIAIAIDTLNLQWEQQIRFGAAAFRGRTSSPQAGEN